MEKDFGKLTTPNFTGRTNTKVRKLNGFTMFIILFSLFILVLGVTAGLTYSGFQSTASSNGTLSFAVNGHQGTLNLTNTKVASYNSQDMTLTFTLASDTGYTTPTISSITMGGTTLTKDGNNFKSSSIIVATYSSSTLTINRADVTGALVITGSSTAQTYTITYNANGGSGTMSNSTPSYNSVATLSANTFTRTGYTFAGWALSTSGETKYVNQADVLNLGNITLYAKWVANKYMISLDNQEADTDGTISVMATYGSAMPSITIPTKSNYSFGGYYTAINGGGTQFYTSAGASAHNMSLTSDTILYAKWEMVVYTISYNYNGGSANNPTTYTAATDTFTLNNPTRTGYTFTGWSGSGSGTTVTITKGSTGNKSFTANWSANTYTITYAGMSGATHGASHPTSATYGTAFTVNNPTKDRYTFTGWDITGMDGVTHTFGNFTTTNTSISGTKETTFNNLRSTSGTVTFTATWSFDGYIVNLITDDLELLNNGGSDEYHYVLWSTTRYYSYNEIQNNCRCVYGIGGRTENNINGNVSEPLRDKTTGAVAKLSGIIYIYTFYASDYNGNYEYFAELVGYNSITYVGNSYQHYYVYEINVTSDLNIYLYTEWNE